MCAPWRNMHVTSRVLWITAILNFAATPVFAKSTGSSPITQEPNIFVGLGAYIPTFSKLSTNRKSEIARYKTPFFIPVVVSGRFFDNGWLAFSPSIFHTLISGRDADKGATLAYSRIQALAVTRFLPLDLRLGTGSLLYWAFGNGGKIVLDNGNSTSTFHAPAYISSTTQFYLVAGIGKVLGPIALDVEGMLSNALSKTRKNYSLFFSISVGVY